MEKLNDTLLNDNEMTLNEFIDYLHQDLNDPASILISIEETMHIMKEEHDTKIIISVRMI